MGLQDDPAYKYERPYIIAVDFDGTLCRANYPGIGEPNVFVITEMKRRQAMGCFIILWTCRNGKQLDEALNWCAERGIHFDAVNEHCPRIVEIYKGHVVGMKIFADEYWDDKAVNVSNIGGVLGRVFRKIKNTFIKCYEKVRQYI